MSIYESINEDLRIYVQKPLEESHLPCRKYWLKIVDSLEHSHGIMWVGHIMSDKKLVAVVENAGRGGCNYYTIKNEKLWHTFSMDAYIAYGNNSEAKDALVQLIDVATVMPLS